VSGRRGALAAAGTALAWCVPAPAAHIPLLAGALGIERRLRHGAGIALTFDDGPHPEGTPAVLAALAGADVGATFFLVGEQVERQPELAAEIVAAGHAVGIHGYRHRLLLRRTSAAVERDLDLAASVIAEASGATPRLYRPPYGVFSWPALRVARRRGWTPVLWSQWGWDWSARASAESIARRATGRLRGGDIVLLHDSDRYSSPGSWRRSVAALPLVIEAAGTLRLPFISLTHSR
jgi:peptidoglycan/xylan/chitin deacetylase (PgdA/CDA1 family)